MFAIITVDTFAYKLMLLVHILSILVAFAPQFVWPMVSAKLAKDGKPVGSTIGALAAGNTAKIHGPALAIAGIFGGGLVGMSEKVFTFSQLWTSIAMLLWFAMLGVVYGLMVPAEKRAHGGDEAAGKKLAMFNGIIHTLLLLMVIDMIWKPGFPS